MINENQDKLQSEVLQKMSNFFKTNKYGFLDLFPRFGKCKVSIEWLNEKFKDSTPIILITYPTNIIQESWKKECETWKYYNPNVFYVNFRSLDKYLDFKPDVFIIDEFHELGSERELEYSKRIIKNSGKTLALSGTISKNTKRKWPELKEIAKYSISEGIDNKITADYIITVHKVKLDNVVKTPNSKGKMLSERERYKNYTYVIEQMKFKGNNYMHLSLMRTRLSNSSIAKREFTKILLNKLKDKRVIVFTGLTEVADSLGISSYHSKSKDNSSLISFQNGEISQLALADSGKLGVTFTNLECVILLNFNYNKESTAQSILRSSKLDYINKIADIRIISLDEESELDKLKESISMLDKTKIKYV